MFEALGAEPPKMAHLPLISDADGGKLSKRLGSLSVEDLREEDGIEPMAIVSLLARLGTSDPIEAFSSLDPLVEAFDFSKFGRGTPKMDVREIERLNAKIVHELSYDDVKDRPYMDGVDDTFWMNVKANLTKVRDVQYWMHVTQDKIDTTVDDADKDYI